MGRGPYPPSKGGVVFWGILALVVVVLLVIFSPAAAEGIVAGRKVLSNAYLGANAQLFTLADATCGAKIGQDEGC